MSKEGPDWLFVVIALICIPLGALIGGSIGYDEFGYVGSSVGIIAGGFAGLIGTYALSFALAFGFVAIVFLGPVAVIVAAIYYLFFRANGPLWS